MKTLINNTHNSKITSKIEENESSYQNESDDCGLEEEEIDYKGALKITRIKNRRYIRMPNFAKRSVNILKNWLNQHLDNPYPTHKEKDLLSQESGLSKRQIQNWFTNARKRIWQPMIKNHQDDDLSSNIIPMNLEQQMIDDEARVDQYDLETQSLIQKQTISYHHQTKESLSKNQPQNSINLSYNQNYQNQQQNSQHVNQAMNLPLLPLQQYPNSGQGLMISPQQLLLNKSNNNPLQQQNGFRAPIQTNSANNQNNSQASYQNFPSQNNLSLTQNMIQNSINNTTQQISPNKNSMLTSNGIKQNLIQPTPYRPIPSSAAFFNQSNLLNSANTNNALAIHQLQQQLLLNNSSPLFPFKNLQTNRLNFSQILQQNPSSASIQVAGSGAPTALQLSLQQTQQQQQQQQMAQQHQQQQQLFEMNQQLLLRLQQQQAYSQQIQQHQQLPNNNNNNNMNLAK
eukprot:403342829